jgi:molybdenum cofactor cytidylyltransferase
VPQSSTAIVLAAGSSTRLGMPKQDVVLDGETLLDRAVRLAGAVCDRVVVVVQPRAYQHVRGRVENADHAEGIASSIRAGVRAAGESRILMLLCDQPRITAEHLRALLAVDAPIVATGYRGIAGVPAVFAPEVRNELLGLTGDRGARVVIDAHEAHVIPFEDAAVDVDRSEDVAQLHRHGPLVE